MTKLGMSVVKLILTKSELWQILTRHEVKSYKIHDQNDRVVRVRVKVNACGKMPILYNDMKKAYRDCKMYEANKRYAKNNRDKLNAYRREYYRRNKK